MRGPDTGEASGLGFDHRPEVISTQGALLLKMDSDGFQVVVGQGHKNGVVHLQSFEFG